MTTTRSVINNDIDEQASFPLFVLPQELREGGIYSNFSLTELSLFAQTARKAEQETASLRQALAAALHAEPESYELQDTTKLAAIALLKKCPWLLFREIKWHQGVCTSPYRIILATGDFWARKQVHEHILPLIEDGEIKAQAEFEKQFPGCEFDPKLGEEQLYDDRNRKQIADVMTQLDVIVKCVRTDFFTDRQAAQETTDAAAKLGQILKSGIPETGLCFPLGIMKAIFQAYEKLAEALGEFEIDQLSFFSFKVIAPALAASTAVDGQCYKTGINNLDMENGPDRQDGLFCQSPKGLPEKSAPISDMLGNTVFVDPADGYVCMTTTFSHIFNWYTKDGKDAKASFNNPAMIWWDSEILDDLWKAKAEAFACCKPPVSLKY